MPGSTQIKRKGRRGSAMIEFCFLLPWYVFLFVGAFDFGFYAYSLIATSNATRAVANYCSASSGFCSSGTPVTTMCTSFALGQLKYMPNILNVVSTCTASPLNITVTYPSVGSCPDGNACVTAQVAYLTPSLISIPGVFPGQVTITRSVTMRLLS